MLCERRPDTHTPCRPADFSKGSKQPNQQLRQLLPQSPQARPIVAPVATAGTVSSHWEIGGHIPYLLSELWFVSPELPKHWPPVACDRQATRLARSPVSPRNSEIGYVSPELPAGRLVKCCVPGAPPIELVWNTNAAGGHEDSSNLVR